MMSIRHPRLLLALLLGGLALHARPAAALDPILTGYWAMPSLEFGNANKIVVGRLNHLAAVFANQDPNSNTSDIQFATMAFNSAPPNSPNYTPDPYVWQYYQLTYDGASSRPALAMDGNGLMVAVWVTRSCPSNPLGAIYYAHQTAVNCESCWTPPTKVVALGDEPAIAADAGFVHLTWSTGDRVEYATFPSVAPPASPLAMGEVVDFANCPVTRFHQPSIALAHPPCGALDVKIAALVTSDEQATAGVCHLAATLSGPRVYGRDVNTQSWSTVFQEVASDPAPNQPEPVANAISLSANRYTGDFYLAWSDQQNQASRTRVGHGNGATWDASQLVDSQSHHVHVAARGGGAAGQFRLAVSDPSWSTGAYTQLGKWSGGMVSWPGPAIGIADTFPLVAHPQALYWSRCSGTDLREIKAYTEASGWSPQLGLTDVAIDPSLASPVNCHLLSLSTAIPFPNCFTTVISIGQVMLAGGSGVEVDFGDTAEVTKLTSTGAELTTLAGAVIQVTWSPGDVLYSWETGFAVATSRSSLQFTSKDARFTVEDVGGKGGAGAR